jgi:hypothetical protein
MNMRPEFGGGVCDFKPLFMSRSRRPWPADGLPARGRVGRRPAAEEDVAAASPEEGDRRRGARIERSCDAAGGLRGHTRLGTLPLSATASFNRSSTCKLTHAAAARIWE